MTICCVPNRKYRAAYLNSNLNLNLNLNLKSDPNLNSEPSITPTPLNLSTAQQFKFVRVSTSSITTSTLAFTSMVDYLQSLDKITGNSDSACVEDPPLQLARDR